MGRTKWPTWTMIDPVGGNATREVSVQGKGRNVSVWIGPRNDQAPDTADLILEGKYLRGFAEALLRALYKQVPGDGSAQM